MVTWGWGEGKEGRITKEHEKTFEDGTFITLIVMMILQAYGYVKMYQTVHFKYRLFVGI